MIKVTPILLLTGYLGSGKTTLVNRILTNKKGIKFAVIVNDIGEVNIDATLIQKGGVVDEQDDSLVALQNGCICCTLKMNLVDQIVDLQRLDRFDYIVIEASGICEPVPIAQTICSIPTLGERYNRYGRARLDSIVSVVDALRMQSEFNCGDALTRKGLDEDDIENLIIQQIEFCNKIILNKVSSVSAEELARIKSIIRAIQPEAEIIECDFADFDLDKIINTGDFVFDKVAGSAAWIRELESEHHDEDHDEDHDHEEHHHHHHHHGEGEALEYNISTFVWQRRVPMDINKFDNFIARKWSKSIIRCKGLCYFADNRDMSYIFESAGSQMKLSESGFWYATMPEDELRALVQREPAVLREWDPEYGDRMQKLVFIGQNMDKDSIIEGLDSCLEDY